MKTKERFITMMLALMAMFMGTTVMAQEAYAVYDANAYTLTFYCDNNKSSLQGVEDIDVYALNGDGETPGWIVDHQADINTVVFSESFKNARPTNTASWFAGPLYGQESQLESIVGLENLNTSEVTNMAGMFICCKKLTTLDLRNFDTHNVTNMGWMFSECTNLRTIIVGSNWDTSNVESSTSMFGSCRNLIGGAGMEYDSNHTDVTYAHIDGENNTPGYLSSVEQASVEAYAMYDASTYTLTFYYDSNRSSMGTNTYTLGSDQDPRWYGKTIHKVVFTDNFKNARPTSTRVWFADQRELTEIEGIENLNTSKVTNMYKMFMNCISLENLDLRSFNTGSVTNMDGMFIGCSGLKSLNISSFSTDRVTNMSGMFDGCSNLGSLNLSSFTTGNVTNMYGMFNNCSSLKSLDLSVFNTYNVTSMGYMFYNCNSLESISFGDSFHTVNVTSMERMFKSCNSLTTLDLTRFDTRNVTNMASMFYGCENLSSLTLGDHFDTSSVTDMSNMFGYCSLLTGIDVSGFNTGNVLNMSEMFGDCRSLTSINLSNFNTLKVTNMSGMFWACDRLTTLDLTNFDTRNVINMYAMFTGCDRLTTLDLTNFDTRKVTDMDRMFEYCTELKTIYVGDNWNTDKVTESATMFKDCTKLVGEKQTTYDGNHIDKLWARIDGGSSRPGYLSSLSNVKYNLWIAGTRVTRQNCSNIPYGDYAEGVSYDPSTKTLTLNNAEIDEGNDYPAIEVSNLYGLTIEVKGNCTLASSESALSVYNNSSVTVTGSGQLTLTSSSEPAIYVGKNTLVTLRDANVEASGADCAIKGEGDDNGYCDMVVNHSNLYAYSESKVDATIYGLHDFTLVNAVFKDVNVVDYYSYIYYGAGFNYNSTKKWLYFDGTYYNEDMHQANTANMIWDDYVIIAPQSGITTGISEAYGPRDSVKGQRDERYNLSGQRVGKDYKGIVIQNGKKVVVK